MSLTLFISAATIACMYLLSRQNKTGLYIGIAAQLLWLVYILENEAWGLLPLNAALWYVWVSGILKWEIKP